MARNGVEGKKRLSRAAWISTLQWERRGKVDRGTLEDWVRMFEPNWEELACDGDLGRTELRLVMLSSASLGTDNIIQLTQRAMAHKLGVTPQAVSRAMRVLVEKGLVFQDGQTHRLNSHIAVGHTLAEVVVMRHQEAKLLRQLMGAAGGVDG